MNTTASTDVLPFRHGAEPNSRRSNELPGSEELPGSQKPLAAHDPAGAQDLAGLPNLRVSPQLAACEILSRLDGCYDLRDACQQLADQLPALLGARVVALATTRRNGSCRLLGLSGQARFDSQGDLTRLLETALDDVVVRGEPIVEPAWEGGSTTPIQEKLRLQFEAGGVWSAPLRDTRGEIGGAWIVLSEQVFARSSAQLRVLTDIGSLIGGRLALLKRAEPNFFERVANRWRSVRRSWRGRVITAGIGLAALLLLVPCPYKIPGDCALQPVVRRFIAAPFSGRLEKALVAPGDLVSEGHVLATLDGREIRLQLAGLEAEQNQATKRRDSALASGKVAEAQLAKLERERLDLQHQLLQDRSEHLEIRSPIAGVVVGGDQEKAEGAPLETGQTLFEIAPLDEMIVEVAIPEWDVAYVGPGMEVTVRLDAFPRRSWQATIDKLHPRSELRDHTNVFVAELRLPNPNGQLRPGMKGRAKVTGPIRLLGWNLFHKAWEALALRLGW